MTTEGLSIEEAFEAMRTFESYLRMLPLWKLRSLAQGDPTAWDMHRKFVRGIYEERLEDQIREN